MPRAALLAVVLSATALGGCSQDGGGGASTGTTEAPRSTSTTAPVVTGSAPDGGVDPLSGTSVTPVSVPPTSRDTALLTDVRAARHEGFDRVVFEFANVAPGYQVRFVDRPVTSDGSGEEVAVDGAHVVEVRMEPALDADLSRESAPRTYTGPHRISPATPQVVELVRTGGFEGVLSWVVGLRDRVAFRAGTLQQPPRLVLDFANH